MGTFFGGLVESGEIFVYDLPYVSGGAFSGVGQDGSVRLVMPIALSNPRPTSLGAARPPVPGGGGSGASMRAIWMKPRIGYIGYAEGGTIVECGPIQSVRTNVAEGTYEIYAQGMMGWVGDQAILANPASANVLGAKVTFANLHLRTIIKRIIQRIIAYPGTTPNITTPEADISGTSRYVYLPTDMVNACDEIRSIGEREDGPEAALRPVFYNANDAVRWELRTGTPELTQQASGTTTHYNYFRDPFATASATLTNFVKSATGSTTEAASTTRSSAWASAPSFRTVFTGRQAQILFSVNAETPSQSTNPSTSEFTRILATVYNSTLKPMIVQTAWDNGSGTNINVDPVVNTIVDPGVTTQISAMPSSGLNGKNGRRANWVGFLVSFQDADAAITRPVYMKNILIARDVAGAFIGYPTTAFSGDTTNTGAFTYTWEGSQYASRSVRVATGQILPDNRWLAGGPEPAVTNVTVTTDGDDIVTEAVEVGTVRDNEDIEWPENQPPISWRQQSNVNITGVGNVPRRMLTESRPDVTSMETLEQHARGGIARGKTFREVWEFDLRTDVQPRWGAWRVGDYCSIVFTDSPGIVSGERRLRIMSAEFSTANADTVHIMATLDRT